MEDNGCTCGHPKTSNWYVECVGCGIWRHGECANIEGDIHAENGMVQIYCEQCLAKQQVPKTCLLQDCTEVAAAGSKFCSTLHAETYYKLKLEEALRNNDEHDLDIVKKRILKLHELPTEDNVPPSGLLKQSFPPVITPVSFPPVDPPPPLCQPVTEDILDQSCLAVLRKIEQLRSENGICGFSPEYFKLSQGISNINAEDQKCQGSIECSSHRDWPQMILARMQNAAISESDRKVPSAAWVHSTHPPIEPGVVRVHTVLKLETKHFIPYVWDKTKTKYFLEM